MLRESPSALRPPVSRNFPQMLPFETVSVMPLPGCSVQFSSVQFSSVQDGIEALGESPSALRPPVSRSFPKCCLLKWYQLCHWLAVRFSSVQFSSVQFKMLSKRSGKAHLRSAPSLRSCPKCCLLKRYQLCHWLAVRFSSVQFSSRWYRSAQGKPICAPPPISRTFSPKCCLLKRY